MRNQKTQKIKKKCRKQLAKHQYSSYIMCQLLYSGEMVEWSKAPHWKCGVLQGTEGSNPSLSAIFFCKKMAE